MKLHILRHGHSFREKIQHNVARSDLIKTCCFMYTGQLVVCSRVYGFQYRIRIFCSFKHFAKAFTGSRMLQLNEHIKQSCHFSDSQRKTGPWFWLPLLLVLIV